MKLLVTFCATVVHQLMMEVTAPSGTTPHFPLTSHPFIYVFVVLLTTFVSLKLDDVPTTKANEFDIRMFPVHFPHAAPSHDLGLQSVLVSRGRPVCCILLRQLNLF